MRLNNIAKNHNVQLLLVFVIGIALGYVASQYVPEYFIVRVGSRDNNITFSDKDAFYVLSALFETNENLQFSDVTILLREMKKEILKHIDSLDNLPKNLDKVTELIQNTEFKTFMSKYGISESMLKSTNESDGFKVMKKVFKELLNKKMSKNDLFKEIINFMKLGILVVPAYMLKQTKFRTNQISYHEEYAEDDELPDEEVEELPNNVVNT